MFTIPSSEQDLSHQVRGSLDGALISSVLMSSFIALAVAKSKRIIIGQEFRLVGGATWLRSRVWGWPPRHTRPGPSAQRRYRLNLSAPQYSTKASGLGRGCRCRLLYTACWCTCESFSATFHRAVRRMSGALGEDTTKAFLGSSRLSLTDPIRL